MPKNFSLTFLFIILAICAGAQSYIGLREIRNFSKQDFNGGAQSWNVLQDQNGSMYFANNEGLLRYDGVYWQIFPISNRTIVRSMEFGGDNRIYVGGQDEIGYFSPGLSGRLAYTSLRKLIPETEQNFADVWDVSAIGKDIFFRSSQKIFQFSGGKITVHSPGGYWLFMGQMDGKLVAQNERLGLLAFNNGKWEPLFSAAELPAGYFRKMISFGTDSTLAIGSSGSFIIHDRRISPFVIQDLPACGTLQYSDIKPLDADQFLLATYSNGFYLVNRSGKIIEHFSQKDGLQNSNVRCLFRDRAGNLWLGLDSGIDFIAYNNSVKQINSPIFNGGAGYGVAQHGDQLYFAMSNGLFSLPLTNLRDQSFAPDKFRQVSGGQTWSVSVLDDLVLAGRDEGFYRVENDQAVPIARNPGYWTFQHRQQGDRSTIIAGNYEGISFFDHQGTQIQSAGKVGDFHESARFIVIDNNNDIWISHPYRGVYKIKMSNGLQGTKLFTQQDGLPSSLNNHVYKIKNRVVVATEKGIYEFNNSTGRFSASPYFREIFGDQGIRYLKEDQSGNIWFVREKNLGVVDFSHLKPTLIYFPELQGRILSGFESIFPMNDNNVFVGGEKGFYHINFENYRENNQPLDVFIRHVSTSGRADSILFGGYGKHINASTEQGDTRAPKLAQQNSSVHFEYSSPLYDQLANLEYSYILEGFDKSWSQWSKKAEKDYTSLPAGDYVFKVKVRNNLMGESKPAVYNFVVLPPWYRSTWAMIVYVLAGIWMGFLFYRQQKKNLLKERAKHQEEQKKLAYLHQLELEKSEKELVKLKNDKLETEIGFKNSELATTAMHLVQKGELLVKIKDELQHITKAAKDKEGATDVKKLIRILNEEDKLQEEWEQFSVHFDKVHSDFLITLKNKFPGLSAHELKLCAYLRMNLSSKEIAQLMSISVRGVEISRYRLRKKLALPTETNLFQFLFDIQKSNMGG